MTLSLFLSLCSLHRATNPLHLVFPPLLLPPPPEFSTFTSRPSAFVRLEQPSRNPVWVPARLPHPSRNEQRAISLLLNACHKSPRAPSTPPLPSRAHEPTLDTPLLSPSVFLLAPLPTSLVPFLRSPHPRQPFLPSSSLHTRFFSLPRPCRPFLLLLSFARLEEVSASSKRRGRNRDTERPFLQLAFTFKEK